MPKQGRRPKTAKQPSTSKTPKTVANPDEFYDLNPAWRISKMHLAQPYGWHILDADKILQIQNRLAHFEGMRWSEILIKGKKSNHLVEVDRLCQEAQRHLASISLEDIDEILSLRLSSRERVWGILDRGVVHLLWWDPEHEICPALLKHT